MSIQRGSAKHGRLLDEQQKHETQGLVQGAGGTRAEEWREPEPTQQPEDDMSPPRRHPPGREPGTPLGITPADVERRSHLATWLSDTGFPADPTKLLAHAERKNAPDAVIEAVRRLPEMTFHNIAEVAEALGLGVERRRW
ncbi:hypothetical protein GCM10010116_00370 [Microbispora rosea subsp. aerata]|nr:DUF2795 domain-containing protein [Microbispora rosea]GGO00277.1 hypothetical protein GCM10010116_00370 [Microbispora rosea subsp. aerata]GIH56790.1 hypothetical protein Mro02_37040 [Microbispora rosea subsp. aerata]GLJ84274.1 hypothetical protein GCM10017588_30020 [Microbispora rosea subsp. aerata]